MEHIKQNDERCIYPMRKVGCFARSSMLLAEMKTGKALNAMQINYLWNWAKSVYIIDENDNLKDSARLATETLHFLGDSGKFAEVGIKNNGVLNLYKWAEKARIKPEYFIQKIYQNGESEYHFRVVDDNGTLIEDPHDPIIRVVRELYTVCYKYYEG